MAFDKARDFFYFYGILKYEEVNIKSHIMSSEQSKCETCNPVYIPKETFTNNFMITLQG